MREILVINGVDYTRHIERKEGMIWTRNDIDTEKTVRTKDGKIRRDKIGTKRKITYKLIHMTHAQLAALDDALSETFFTATYLDLHGVQVSERIPKGVFFTNRRGEKDGRWTVEAFDAMRKADVVWGPGESLKFPLTMPDAVREFAQIMGVEIDPRTVLNSAYNITYPDEDYTIRDILHFIAAAHGGNWIMSDAGKLLLVPLWSYLRETNYLVTEYGEPITFGGVRILVG